MDTERKSELINASSCSEGKISHSSTEANLNPNEALVQDAIETIGMGRYQWQLMVSCGFGFVVDQVSACDILSRKRNSPNILVFRCC